MSASHFIVSEYSHKPILIVDREGSIGLALYARLKDHVKVVLVNGREPEIKENVYFISFADSYPQIPEDPYSHIFFITESEKDLGDFLQACITKSHADKSKLFVIIPYCIADTDSILKILGAAKEARVILTGDIFQNLYQVRKRNIIEEIFHQAKTHKKILLPDTGLEKVYPVAFDDVVIELIKIGFGKIQNRIFFLYPAFPMTCLRLSHVLQKSDPLLKIDFTHPARPARNAPACVAGGGDRQIRLDGQYVFPETYPVAEKLIAAYKKDMVNTPDIPPLLPLSSHFQPPAFKLPLFPVLFLIFILTLVLLPGVAMLFFGLQARQSIIAAKTDFEKGKSILAQKDGENAREQLYVLEKILPVFTLETNAIGQQGIAKRLSGQLKTGKTIIAEMDMITHTVDIFKKIGTGKSVDRTQDVQTALENVKKILITGENLVHDPVIPFQDRRQLENKLLQTALIPNIIDSLPVLLGTDKKKTYAVLFQNNTELRPGGGFIGSYGILTIDKGKVEEFTIHDVYDADGQLKGHVEPPFQIRRYLAKEHLFLRDSNFDVDFLNDASQVAFFLQLESNQQVDGVIGIDLSFVKSVIAGLQEVYVPVYNEKVTADNFFLLTETHAEKKFFPGSTQKKDFLRTLLDAVQAKLVSGNVNYQNVFDETLKALAQKHILFAFADKASEDIFTANGLSSTLWDGRQKAPNNFNDFLGINEANLGVNKVNYFLERKLEQRVQISDSGDVLEQVTATFLNKYKDASWPGGAYKNYLRFLLPQNASLVKVFMDGQEQSIVPAVTNFDLYEKPGFIPPSGLEVDSANEKNRTLYGFLLTIPPNSKKTVTIIYVLQQKANLTQPTIQYSMYYFKQPGTDEYPYTLSISYPSAYRLIGYPSTMRQEGEQAVYTTVIKGDEIVNVTMGRK